MALAGVTDLRSRAVDELSGGQRQRAWIAMTLAQETPILLLDEPTTFLDVAHQQEVMALVRRLNRDEGRTVVLVLHDVNAAAAVSQHIVAMRDGVIVAEGSPADTLTPEILERVFDCPCDVVRHPDSGQPVSVPRGRRGSPAGAGAAAAAPPLAVRLARAGARIGDARLLDRLVRGRGWIALVAIGLMGIVFMQVSMLRLNAGISRAITSAETLEQQNSTLRADISKLDAGDRIADTAAAQGMIRPPAGDVNYLDARKADGRAAAKAIRRPQPVKVAPTAAQSTATAAQSTATTAQATATAAPAQVPAQTQAAPAQTQTAPARTTPTQAAPAQVPAAAPAAQAQAAPAQAQTTAPAQTTAQATAPPQAAATPAATAAQGAQ
jgi:hypothetical protein